MARAIITFTRALTDPMQVGVVEDGATCTTAVLTIGAHAETSVAPAGINVVDIAVEDDCWVAVGVDAVAVKEAEGSRFMFSGERMQYATGAGSRVSVCTD